MKTRHSCSRNTWSPVLLSILILFPFGHVHTQRSRVVQEVSRDSLMTSLKELTGALPVLVSGRIDTITTRMVLTTGNRLASQYIAERMSSMGLEVDRVHFPAEDSSTPPDAPNVLFTGLAGSRNSTALWMCSDFGEVFFSNDTGLTWRSRLRSGVPEKDRLDWIIPLNDSVIVAMGRTGRLVMTGNGGETWRSWSSGFTAVQSFACTEGGAMIVLGEDGALSMASNFGQVWTSLIPDVNLTVECVEGRGSTLLIAGTDTSQSGEKGVLLRSIDGGAAWSSIGADWFGPPGVLRALDPLHIWIGTMKGEIYYTISGGNQWSVASFSGTDQKAECITFSDFLNGWVLTTERQLFRTTDGGSTVPPFRERMSPTRHFLNAPGPMRRAE